MENAAIIQPSGQQHSDEIEDELLQKLTEREGIVERVHARTVELALLAGRSCHQIRQGDYEQAKREIPYDDFQHRV